MNTNFNKNNNKELIIIFGKGYISKKLVNILENEKNSTFNNIDYYVSNNRTENRESIIKEFEELKPTYVINCAGKQGTPNVDWCEDNQQEVIRSNIIGTLNLIDICYLKKIHITHITSGCLYYYNDEHPKFSNKGFKEYEQSNYFGSFYSRNRYLGEQLTYPYDSNTLSFRIRLPICDEIYNPRNIVYKLIGYEKVINEPNSWTVLNDLCPIILDMTIKKYKGFYNLVNPGVITHNEVLDLYIKYVDPNFTYKNFSVQEQRKILNCDRSNNQLDSSKLESIYPNQIPDVKVSIEQLFKNFKK
ncbi:hypothetical protein ACTFIV_000356 [Dictyostelium citrinum]